MFQIRNCTLLFNKHIRKIVIRRLSDTKLPDSLQFDVFASLELAFRTIQQLPCSFVVTDKWECTVIMCIMLQIIKIYVHMCFIFSHFVETNRHISEIWFSENCMWNLISPEFWETKFCSKLTCSENEINMYLFWYPCPYCPFKIFWIWQLKKKNPHKRYLIMSRN